MKAIVENPLMNLLPKAMEIYVEVLNTITSCNNEEELRECMKLIESKYYYSFEMFDYGFGKNHMWFSEKGSFNRLLIVEF